MPRRKPATTLTASRLRQDVYRILDRILETGEAVEVLRRGQVLRIVPQPPPDKLARLKRRPYLSCNPEEIVHLDWSSEWKP